jgi:ABC-type dipeptide/oligopeptide/nickel transport system ATPase component
LFFHDVCCKGPLPIFIAPFPPPCFARHASQDLQLPENRSRTVAGQRRVGLTSGLKRRLAANRAKSRKDLDQARDLIEVLAIDRPDDRRDAFEAAVDAGRKWREAIAKSMKQRPDIGDMFPPA